MELNEPSAKYLVKVGFKQSEVGWIPSDWTPTHIGEIASVSAGGTPSRKLLEYWNGDIPWVTTTELNHNRVVETEQYITRMGLENSSAKLVAPGAVLIALYGQGKTRGKVSLLGIKAATNQACAAIVVFPSTSNRFVLHSLHSQYRSIRSLSNAGSQDNLSSGIVKGIQIPLPPTRAEQEDIADALTDADTLIESLEQLLTKKRQIKQGAMQELLAAQRRLPGFSGDWKPAKLKDLADIRSGGTPSTQKDEFWDGDILWCTPTDITALNGSKYLADTHRKITAMGMKACSADLIPANSIVMTSRATIGECAINLAPLCTNQGFKNFVPFPHVDVQFLYYMLTTQKAGFISLCGGSTFLEIGKTQLRPYEVSMPPTKDEQTAIATILSDMDTEITALEARLTKARQLKQGMAQALLTGRIRLV